MRFGNSSRYFGPATHAQCPMPLNSAMGKAFHVIVDPTSSPLVTFRRRAVFLPANSAVTIRSKVTNCGSD